MEKKSIVRIQNISKTYQAENGEVEALKGINFDVKEGEFISIIGPSGCGKSTLLSIISGLESKTNGEVYIDGKVGYMLQKDNLLEWRTIYKNVLLGLEIQKALTEENKKPFDILICYRLDRISRNIAHFSNLMNYITNLGTNFVSIKEQFDTKTPMGRAMMYIASVFAQLEREVIAERIRDNMIELAKTGRWLGGKTPTGYKSERIELVDVYEQSEDSVLEKKKKKATKLISIDEELELIQEIGYKFLELKSLTKLEAYFVKNKIATKNNLDFSVSTLRRILVNPVYAPNDKDVLEYFNKNGVTIYADGDRANFDGKYGLIGYGKKDGKKDRNIKDWIVSVGFHQPAFKEGIVWVKIQELLEKNKEKRYRADCKHDFLFSGILRCSECGSYMRPKIAQGERFYYICELKEKSRGMRCHSKNINGKALDELMMKKLEKIKYIDINSKTQIVTPTQKGEAIYDVVNFSMPDMLNAKLTASWEKGLDLVAKKEIKPDEFMTKLVNYINSKFNKLIVKK